MKRYLNILLMGACLVVITACDFRYRYSDSGASPEEVQGHVERVIQNLQTQGNTVRDLYEDPSTYLYFAQWSRGVEPMGPLEAVAPIDWEFITGEQASNIDLVRIYFFHKIYDDGSSDDVLVLEYEANGSPQTPKYFSNIGGGETGLAQDGVFTTLLEGSPSLSLESYDVLEDDLDVDIQLRLYSGEDGQTYLGKFSNLEGFSI